MMFDPRMMMQRFPNSPYFGGGMFGQLPQQAQAQMPQMPQQAFGGMRPQMPQQAFGGMRPQMPQQAFGGMRPQMPTLPQQAQATLPQQPMMQRPMAPQTPGVGAPASTPLMGRRPMFGRR